MDLISSKDFSYKSFVCLALLAKLKSLQEDNETLLKRTNILYTPIFIEMNNSIFKREILIYIRNIKKVNILLCIFTPIFSRFREDRVEARNYALPYIPHSLFFLLKIRKFLSYYSGREVYHRNRERFEH